MHRNKRSIKSLLGVTVLISCLLAGCSMQPIHADTVKGTSFTNRVESPAADIAHTGQSQQTVANANWTEGGKIHREVKQPGYCRVTYHPSYIRNHWMVVEGTIGKQRKYPIVLDTGASPALVVNDIHVKENNLVIQSFRNKNRKSADWGICYLPEMKIGDIIFTDWSCFYSQQHKEVRIFGHTDSKNKAIILGVPALMKFSYVVFDSVKKEVEFSLEKLFEPGDLDSPAASHYDVNHRGKWAQYPIEIEEDFIGNAFLFVKIPIAGIETELQLDTGSGRGLAIGDEVWNVLSEKFLGIKLRKSKELYPYIGNLICRQANIPKLQVGHRTVKNAKISVFPENSPLLDDCNGLVGMQYFLDTVLVLDFKRNLMWVKNT